MRVQPLIFEHIYSCLPQAQIYGMSSVARVYEAAHFSKPLSQSLPPDSAQHPYVFNYTDDGSLPLRTC